MLELLNILGISKAAAIAGAVGAAIAAIRQKGINAFQRVIMFLVGFGIALYLPKFIIGIFNLPDDPNFYAGVGFVFGYFGPALLDVVSDVVEKTKTVDWKEIVTGWVKKG
jgi:hypothetical protein